MICNIAHPYGNVAKFAIKVYDTITRFACKPCVDDLKRRDKVFECRDGSEPWVAPAEVM